MRRAFLILPLAMAACSTPSGPVPSLAPRAAEAIDPRVPIPSAPSPGTVDPALSRRLAGLLDQVRAGDQAFIAAAGEAERLVAAAGSPDSESWIAAQQAVSALIEARGPTTRALGDIDEIAAQRLETVGWITPANQAAFETAASQATAVDQRQAALIESLQARLGG
jgi:antitoxin (DNA-binding transcriptional repressor) of toxin-antitoxin stability system